MKPRRIVIVCFPGMEILDATGPASVFASATWLARPRAGFRFELVAAQAGPVACAGGMALHAERALAHVRGAIDTLLCAGGLEPALRRALPLAPTIARVARRARRVASVCSGAFLLAQAGLLAGRRVATHWAGCAELARRFPDCKVERDPIFVRDGHVWTSAGVTAGIDLALALVEEDLGARLALEVARWGVMYLRRPGGQSQFSAPLAAQVAQDDAIARLCSWMAAHLDADLSIEALARRAGMSVRHLARVFRRETGATPARHVERLRLEAARRALELTRASAKQVAAESGFGTVETMHRAFQRTLATTPLAYRARFALRA
jgi:transcriptional regulator GlxA family with amidase domain